VQRLEKRGTIETAHRLKMLCSRVFRFGIATGKIKYDPTIGFRAMASTMLHEQGWDSDVIERQLAHKEGTAIHS